MRHLWVWGAGELGGRVARTWNENGGPVTPLTKSDSRHDTLRADGLVPRQGMPNKMDERDVLLISIAGTAALDKAVEQLSEQPPPARVVITSSTGYYGEQGGLISATTPPGTTERALEVAAMETRFKEWAGERGVVIRLGGLYRQGRGPLNVMKKRGNAPIGAKADRVIPLLHYDDAASACVAALRVENPRSEYLVVSPPCPTRHEFYLAASVILQLPLPSFGDPSGLPRAEYDVGDTVRDLGYDPQHPKWQKALIP